jgi:hypothetical protein
MSVESVEAKEIVGLNIICKDGRIIRWALIFMVKHFIVFHFDLPAYLLAHFSPFRVQARSNEDAITWYKKLTQITCGPRSLEDVFAFKFHAQLLLLKEKSIPWIARGDGSDGSQQCSIVGGRKTSYESLCKVKSIFDKYKRSMKQRKIPQHEFGSWSSYQSSDSKRA